MANGRSFIVMPTTPDLTLAWGLGNRETSMRDETMSALLSAPGDGRTVRNPIAGAIEFKARAQQTAGVVSAFESAPSPGEGPPLHIHKDDNEVLVFLDAPFRLKTDDVIREAPSGSFAFIPKGVPHTWQNIGESPGRVLFMFLPGAVGMEEFFEQFAGDVTGAASPTEMFATLAEAAGMKVVGPSLRESDPLP
jgi:quercetin dioxygenase-like cupin family protein